MEMDNACLVDGKRSFEAGKDGDGGFLWVTCHSEMSYGMSDKNFKIDCHSKSILMRVTNNI